MPFKAILLFKDYTWLSFYAPVTVITQKQATKYAQELAKDSIKPIHLVYTEEF